MSIQYDFTCAVSSKELRKKLSLEDRCELLCTILNIHCDLEEIDKEEILHDLKHFDKNCKE